MLPPMSQARFPSGPRIFDRGFTHKSSLLLAVAGACEAVLLLTYFLGIACGTSLSLKKERLLKVYSNSAFPLRAGAGFYCLSSSIKALALDKEHAAHGTPGSLTLSSWTSSFIAEVIRADAGKILRHGESKGRSFQCSLEIGITGQNKGKRFGHGGASHSQA